jgi:hypothetical protein
MKLSKSQVIGAVILGIIIIAFAALRFIGVLP